MAATVAASSVRTQSKSVRTDLQGVRAGSHMLRMAAKTDRETTIRLVREVMAETGTSQKNFALCAQVPESVISEALSPNGTRNIAAEWLFDQEDAFVCVLIAKLSSARGLTDDSQRAAKAARIGELVRLLVEVA